MARLVLILLSLFIWREDAAGASYYISPTGSDTTPGTCTMENPCATFIRCNQVMVAGDTCYARGGTYNVAPNASGSGYNGWRLYGYGPGPKTFRGYPGEVAIIQPLYWHSCSCEVNCLADPCGSPTTDRQDSTITIGDARLDNYTFSDLTIYGRFNVAETEFPPDWAADDLTLERIVFKCPGGWGQGNTVNIMTSGHNDTSNGTSVPRDRLTIRNNLFLFDATCPDYTALNTRFNRPLDGPDTMHLYANSDLVIENNDSQITSVSQLAYRVVTQSLPPYRFHFWTKGLAQRARVRYNYCQGASNACVSFNSGGCPAPYRHVCYESGVNNGKTCTVREDCGYPGDSDAICADCGNNLTGNFKFTAGDNQAYNNISNQAGLIGWDASQHGQFDKSYNNTIYRPAPADPAYCPDPNECSDGIQWWSGVVSRGLEDTEVFNNIIYSPTTDGVGNYRAFVRWGGGAGDGGNHSAWNDNAKGHICKQDYFDNNIYWDVNNADPVSFEANELLDAVDGDGDGTYMEAKLFSSLTAWKTYLAAACSGNPSTRENSSREVDPLFVNPAAGDFRLQALSPARTGGRGVGYPSYLGAIDPVNGTTIGCTFDPQCYGYTAPANNPRSKVR